MASIPVAGMPAAKFFGPPGRRRAPDGKFLARGQIIMVVGAEELGDALKVFADHNAAALKLNALNEIGLFAEAEVKTRTPVQYGVLRASIGHWTPEHLTEGHDADDGTAADAIFELTESRVTWGTSVKYAPWIEDGFTMATRRAVWFDDVQGFRMVNPFSYRGAHMFAASMPVVAAAAPKIIEHWVGVAIAKSGLS